MNIEQLRNETKGASGVLHFNNAGTSLMPDVVYDSIVDYLDNERLIGGYEILDLRIDELESFYPVIAGFIGAKPEEIAFKESATHAWTTAFFSIPFKSGDKILTSHADYQSNYMSYVLAEKRLGTITKIVPSTSQGELDVDALDSMIDEKTKLISVTHIPTNNGLVNPAEEIGKVAKKYGILFLLDACQSVGQYPVDVEKIGCDMLTATGRKYIRGPRGTGFLYVRKDAQDKLDPIFLDQSSATWNGPNNIVPLPSARRFELWEWNAANKIGLSKAIEYANNIGIESIWETVKKRAIQLRRLLRAIDGVKVLDIGSVQSGIVTFEHTSFKAEKIKKGLFDRKMNTSLGEQTTVLQDIASPMPKYMVRPSVHYYNTEEEVETFCDAVQSIVAK